MAQMEKLIPTLMREYSKKISNASGYWEEGLMQFGFRSGDLEVRGKLEVGDTEVLLDVVIPLPLRPIQDQIRSKLEELFDEAFSDAAA